MDESSEKNGTNDYYSEDLNYEAGSENQTVVSEVVVLDSKGGGGAAKTASGGSCCLLSGGSSSVYKSIPPFLLKIHDMLENKETDPVISWGCNGTSFVITNPHLFADNVLPMYFRHNNFQSFITQLNSYGFKKISWEHWEYSNEYFRKGERHLLKNIKRRNQVISPQNQPPQAAAGGNMEKEVEIMMKEHGVLKREVTELKDKKERLEKRLASLKNQLTIIKFKTTCGGGGRSSSSGSSDNNSCNNLANINNYVEFIMSEHGNNNKMPELNEEEEDAAGAGMNKHEANTLMISLEDMFRDSSPSSSHWVQYFKDFLQKLS